MSGHDTLRGIYLQVISSLFEVLDNDIKLEKIILEPENTSDKVDMLIINKDGRKIAFQVKSSINPIGFKQAELWANELKKSFKADFYQLILIGPVAKSLFLKFIINEVRVPPPKNLDINTMQESACYKLLQFLNQESLIKINPSAESLKNLLSILIVEFFNTTLNKNEITKTKVKEILKRNLSETPDFTKRSLIFSNIAIKKKYWTKHLNAYSFFTKRKVLYFEGDGNYGTSKSIIFELVLYNNSNDSLLIDTIGIEILSVANLLYPKGMPSISVKKIPLSKYNFKINVAFLNERDLNKSKIKIMNGNKYGGDSPKFELTYNINKEYTYELNDPLEIESKRFFRFKLTLVNYLENIANNSLIRIFISSNNEPHYSDFIHVNSINRIWI
jgi:hypothetical protein